MSDTNIESVTFQPFIGKQYEKEPYKILLLGESHYRSEFCAEYCATNPDKKSEITRAVVNRYLAGVHSRYRFFTGALYAIFGQDAKREQMEQLAFYNFVQEYAGDNSRVTPSADVWKAAAQPFFDVLRELKPDFVVCCGKRLYDHLPDDPDKEKRAAGTELFNDGKYLWSRRYFYHIDDRAIPLVAIRHPSSVGFNGSAYHLKLKEFCKEIE